MTALVQILETFYKLHVIMPSLLFQSGNGCGYLEAKHFQTAKAFEVW